MAHGQLTIRTDSPKVRELTADAEVDMSLTNRFTRSQTTNEISFVSERRVEGRRVSDKLKSGRESWTSNSRRRRQR